MQLTAYLHDEITDENYAMPRTRKFKDAREYLASLPVGCIGPDRLLSRALYRFSYDNTRNECVTAMARLIEKHGREVVLEHLILLPDHGWDWIVNGFTEMLRAYAEVEGDEMKWRSPFVGEGMVSGWAEESISKKWSAEFLRDAIALRERAPKLQHPPCIGE